MWNDLINVGGSGGNDKMYGLSGDDIYYVHSPGDWVVEEPNQGNDWVYSSIYLYWLPNNVENMRLLEGGEFNGFGNSLDNQIVGNFENNSLDGFAGNDLLFGNGGNDILDGGPGSDRMYGGHGDDHYYVESVGDDVVEFYGQGIDTVNSKISYTLPYQVENLELLFSANLQGTGNKLDNQITGNSGNNLLMGLMGDDKLIGLAGIDTLEGGYGNDFLDGGVGSDFLDGGSGNDFLDGGVGSDFMAGGYGNDIYVVDSSGDVVSELEGAGIDVVHSRISHALSANVENLRLFGSENIAGRGNRLSNELRGNSGDNLLTGGQGDDWLFGGDGTDTADYFGARADYRVIVNGGGTWTVTDTNFSDGDEGTDQLFGIEQIRFSDALLNLIA